MNTMATGPTTGASTAPVQVVGDLNDAEYLNWYKANRALHCTIDVLRNVCIVKVQTFHTSLLQKHGNATCSASCTHNNITHHNKWGSWSISCPHNVCSNWLRDIVKERTRKSTRLNWTNSTFTEWQTKPWQIAKIYMDHGQDIASYNPTDTDAAGIIQLLLNFNRLQPMLEMKKVDAVSLSSFFHSPFLICINILLFHIYVSQVICC